MIKRKHLVRCNSEIKKKVVKNKKEYWKSDGHIEFEVYLDIKFLMKADEEILNKVFSELIKQHDTDYFRYEYIDFELIYHNPIKLKKNIVKIYDAFN